MRPFLLWTIAFSALLVSSCRSNLFFLKSKGAEMPVLVKGNIASKVFILFLHGGPGASGFYDSYGGFFSEIETKYAIVYWEQRASGISQGNALPATITVPQFFEDIDHVIAILRQKYNHPTIVLMGHSWGGGLGIAYLVNNANKNFNDVKAWIDIDGDHDDVLSDSLSAEYVKNFAKEQIPKHADAVYWQQALRYYDSVAATKLTSVHSRYVARAGGYWHKVPYNYASVKNLLFSSSTGFDFVKNNPNVQKYIGNESLGPYTKDMHLITIPVLLIWGKYDGTIPVAMSDDAYKRLGTMPDKKRIVVLENSAHSPYIEEKEKFNTEVINFLLQNITQ